MTTFKVDIHIMRDLYTFMFIAQECKGSIRVYSSTNKNRIADGKSQLGLMSLGISKPITVEIDNDEDAKLFDRIEVLKDDDNGTETGSTTEQ